MDRCRTWPIAAAALAAVVVACTTAPEMGRVAPDPACTIERLAGVPDLGARDAQRSPMLSDDEARRAGECIEHVRLAGFVRADHPIARAHGSWTPMTWQAYRSEHGMRNLHVRIFANDRAASYAQYEDGVPMPVGARIAKGSYVVSHNGAVSPGPLFAMEKMAPGFDAEGADWRYTLMESDGAVVGETRGRNADAVRFCFECHRAAKAQDFLLFPAPIYRRKG